jgi:hypothetical protein
VVSLASPEAFVRQESIKDFRVIDHVIPPALGGRTERPRRHLERKRSMIVRSTIAQILMGSTGGR